MCFRCCLFAAGFLALASWLHGAESGDRYEPVVWRTDVGGPRKSVSAFAQSPDGFLWLLNPETLSRFDGMEFRSVTIPELPDGTAPVAMWSDPAGFRMAGTGGTLWDWREGRFSTLLPAGTTNPVLAWGQPDGSALVLAVDGYIWHCRAKEAGRKLPGEALPVSGVITWLPDGDAWWLTPKGLAHGSASGAEQVPLPAAAGSVTSVAAVSPGSVWVGTDRALFRLSGTVAESLLAPPGQGEWRVKRLHSGSGKGLWMEANDALWVLQNGQWKSVPVGWPPRGGLRTASVDAADNFWYANRTGELAALRPDGSEIVVTGISELRGGGVDSLFGDREGNMWAGITRVGLVQFKRQRFRSLTSADGLSSPMLWTVCEDGRGAIWFAGQAPFLGRWQNGMLTVMDKESGAIPEHVSALWCDAGGNLLAGFQNKGAMREEAGSFVLVPPRFGEFKCGDVHFIFDDTEGRRWLGLGNGLVMADESSARLYGRSDGLKNSAMRSIAQTLDGTVWVGTASGGASWFEDGKFHTITRAQGLPNDSVYALCAGSDGSLWIGTVGGGLTHRRGEKMTTYNMSHGLPDDRIMQIIEDGAGYLWVGTRAGLARISLESLDACNRGEKTTLDLVTFDRSDGLPTREFSGGKQPAVWKAHDGTLWFPTTGGLTWCRSDGLVMNRVAPVPQILSVSLNGRPAAEAPDPGSLLGPLEFGVRSVEVPPGPHSLELRWTAPGMISGDKMRYSYRLEGVESAWTPLSTRTAATYGTLPPGGYRFLVRACNHDGTWSAAPAALSVTVHPQWWQRTGVRIGGVLLGAGLISLAVWAAVRARHRRRLADAELRRVRETERARIARDLHDDLGSSLTEISMLATTVPGTAGGPEILQGKLSAISGKARTLVEALDEIVWAVNPRHDTADSLASYLTGFMREFLTAANIACSFDVPSPLPEFTLEAESRHSLFLALKEVLNNIVRHSAASHVKLTLRAASGELTITVEDDGCGLPEAQSHNGDGLHNIRERLRGAGGDCVMESTGAAGTLVRLRLPIHAVSSRS